MKLPPDVQDDLIYDLEIRAKPAVVDDPAQLLSESGRFDLAERFGRYRFVVELKSELMARRSKK